MDSNKDLEKVNVRKEVSFTVNSEVIDIKKTNDLETVSMEELYNNIYGHKISLIEGLLSSGVYILAGAPKIGKSFLVAQIAYHISTGMSLWGYTTRKSKVLYMALEDNYRRLQERMYRMFGINSTKDLYFTIKANNLEKGLKKQISNFITEYPDTKLIIIDTFQKIREITGNKASYTNDYQTIDTLKTIADKFNVCILLVHHTRKQVANDAFDLISGTNGLLDAADGGFVMQKSIRTDDEATLDISCRDEQDQKIYLQRNNETLLWEVKKIEKELWKKPSEPLLDELVTKVMDKRNFWEGSPTDLVLMLDYDIQPNVITKKLNILADRLKNEYNINYEKIRVHDGRKIRLWRIQTE